jgi:hypothetical protein
MKKHALRIIALCLAATAPCVAAVDDFLDRFDDFLTVNLLSGGVKARLSGTVDLEAYSFSQPPPGLIYTDRYSFFNPRLTLFLDAQIGPKLYLFAQARWDKGFDPGTVESRLEADEYALRYTPWDDGRLSVQVGKFATVFGSWAPRHLTWDSPFISAPLPYENLTGMWDESAADSVDTLHAWGGVGKYAGTLSRSDTLTSRLLRLPVIWGPSYTTGIAVFGHVGKFEYAAEMKNAALSSRVEYWNATEAQWDRPTFTGRLGYRPNQSWSFGFSGSVGCYLSDEADESLAAGHSLSDYRQIVLGQDISFEWHHWQLWAEFIESRFEIPTVGNADSFAYYIEAKYKFTPQLFGAVRWNQHIFGTIADSSGIEEKWGGDIWRTDLALGYRFTAHAQLKIQYSVERHAADYSGFGHTFAGQFTLRF